MDDFGLMPVSSSRIATITFLECEHRGLWKRKAPMFEEPNWTSFVVSHKDGAEVWIVRSDGLRRAWRFKEGSVIKLGQSAIQFDHDSIIEELTVDEDAQQGRPSRPTVI